MEQHRSVGGFTILPVALEGTAVKFSVYFKEHSAHHDDGTLPARRTIFVVNVPPFANVRCVLSCCVIFICSSNSFWSFVQDDSVRSIFSVFGHVHSVKSKPFSTSLKSCTVWYQLVSLFSFNHDANKIAFSFKFMSVSRGTQLISKCTMLFSRRASR